MSAQNSQNDISAQLQNKVSQAFESGDILMIKAGGSKDFYGRSASISQPATELNISQHYGIISYEPTELVITARAGTPLKVIEQLLAENRQMLAFEPPAFGKHATLGGTIACNLSGPRRAYSGAARDYVLGTKIINGKAEILSFGGTVMKNVAGYDVSRLMAGAMGTLGVILEASIKVVPQPETEITLVQTIDISSALNKLHQWSALPLPMSASCFYQDHLYIRLSGTEKSLRTAKQKIGGEILSEADAFWHSIKEQQHDFFNNKQTLWRLSTASNTTPLTLADDTLYEWGGALRWFQSNQSPSVIRESSEKTGHTTLFRSPAVRDEVFQTLPQPLLKLHQNLKRSFDPHGVFNIGRLYPEF
ncbi:MAG: glycolate oxidase subunit GlcE [Methyloprofundus sp.]|nr:glycolate oxidase subunit GlcE [Methyloprofundus sp.]